MRIGLWLIRSDFLSLALLAAHRSAFVSPLPAAKCQASKLTAAGKAADGDLICEAAGAKNGSPVDPG
jgi:hypothetical protein